jgi:hypothetical protein
MEQPSWRGVYTSLLESGADSYLVYRGDRAPRSGRRNDCGTPKTYVHTSHLFLGNVLTRLQILLYRAYQ